MDFSDDECITLINLYKSRPILWDPCNSMYKMAKKKIDFWQEIANEMGKDVNQTRKKMDSLLASYRRERQREGTSGHSGAGTNEIYHSKWFAFAEMQFLNDKFKPRTTTDTIINSDNNNIESTSPDDKLHEEEVENISQITDHEIQNVPELFSENMLASQSTTIPQNVSVQKNKNKRKAAESPKKFARKKNLEDSMLNETFKIIQDISASRKTPKFRDDCDIFGELVASKLRKLDFRQRLIAQQQINSILFNLEMNSIYPQVHQLYSSTPTSSPSPSVYEMPQFSSQSSPAYLSSTNSPSLQDEIQFSRQSPLLPTQSSKYQLEYQLPQQAPPTTTHEILFPTNIN